VSKETITIWSCLTCAQCGVRCPANIDFPDFVRRMRDRAHGLGYDGVPAHNAMLQTVTAIQAQGAHQKRTAWVGDGKIAQKGDVFYFVG